MRHCPWFTYKKKDDVQGQLQKITTTLQMVNTAEEQHSYRKTISEKSSATKCGSSKRDNIKVKVKQDDNRGSGRSP